jgi:class 3 adenylate cyclase
MIDLDDDAPMVARKSFPEHNQAELIATLGLEIRKFLYKFPELKCELGFETGSAVAGIVGDEHSPQFCLFGNVIIQAKSFSTLVSGSLCREC